MSLSNCLYRSYIGFSECNHSDVFPLSTDFNDLGAGNKPAPVINLFLFSCTSKSMGSQLVTEIKYKVCNDHGCDDKLPDPHVL